MNIRWKFIDVGIGIFNIFVVMIIVKGFIWVYILLYEFLEIYFSFLIFIFIYGINVVLINCY